MVYDINVERINKVNKFLKTYLHWRQNSVFEGNLSSSQLERVKARLKELIDEKADSVLVYELPSKKNLELEVIGIEKNPIENIL
ncbi:MAG: CRISPR-associated endonuclease Cas2 [Candidatus Atabeyarchaeum deiterrae]